MEIPVPGQPVRGSRSGPPTMAVFDLLGRSWARGVLWTLCEPGPTTVRNLQGRCETISPAVLSQRLKELHAAKFGEKSDRGYVASPLGLRVYEELVPLGATARHWAGVLASMSATSR